MLCLLHFMSLYSVRFYWRVCLKPLMEAADVLPLGSANRLLIEAGVSATCRIVHKPFTGFRTLQLNNHPRGDESRQKRRVETHRSRPYATGNARHNQGHAPTATAEGPIERGGSRQHPHWNQGLPQSVPYPRLLSNPESSQIRHI